MTLSAPLTVASKNHEIGPGSKTQHPSLAKKNNL